MKNTDMTAPQVQADTDKQNFDSAYDAMAKAISEGRPVMVAMVGQCYEGKIHLKLDILGEDCHHSEVWIDGCFEDDGTRKSDAPQWAGLEKNESVTLAEG